MKYEWFEGSTPRSGFKVYHLTAEVGTTELGKFTEPEFIFSEVYSGLKKAEAAGRKFLKKTIKDIYKKYYYDSSETIKEGIERCIDTENITGGFTIKEFDPLFRENYEKYCKEYEESNPTSNIDPKVHPLMRETEYEYNILGNLTYQWIWLDGLGYFHLPADDLPGAGLKFQAGDFVTTSKDNHKQVYVVSGVCTEESLDKATKNPYWENTVQLDYIDEYGRYIWDWDIFNESMLKKYDGEVSETMMILSKILKGEIDISKTLWNKMERNEINMSGLPSLKEAIAQDKINSPEESMHYREQKQ